MRSGPEAGLAVEHLKDTLGWSTDHGTITDDSDRALHQLGVFEQERDDCIFADVIVAIETEFGEVTVVSNHVGNRIRQLGDDVSKRRFVKEFLEVLNDGEIDFTFFQQGDRPTSFASTRVEIQRHVFVAHVCRLGDEWLLVLVSRQR